MTDAKNAYVLFSSHWPVPSGTSRHGASCAGVSTHMATGMPGSWIRRLNVQVVSENGQKQAVSSKCKMLASGNEQPPVPESSSGFVNISANSDKPNPGAAIGCMHLVEPFYSGASGRNKGKKMMGQKKLEDRDTGRRQRWLTFFCPSMFLPNQRLAKRAVRWWHPLEPPADLLKLQHNLVLNLGFRRNENP